MRARLFLLAVPLFFITCSLKNSSLSSYNTYKHPSLSFSIQYPKAWEMREGGVMGTQVSFISNNKDEVFRANVNVDASKADITDLEKLRTLTQKHLGLLLNQYEVITSNPTHLGMIEGFEIRAKYTASEGNRIIRSVVAIDKKMEYVFTFTCSLDDEKNYTQIVNHMIQSFSL